MRTVEAVLEAVYGTPQKDATKKAADSIGVKRHAPWNWLKLGHFSANAAIKIAEDAKEKGVDLLLSEIPTLDKKREIDV